MIESISSLLGLRKELDLLLYGNPNQQNILLWYS